MKLTLVIADSALELIPEEVRNHPAVVADAKRRGVSPNRILLDRSIHHAAMRRLKEEYKRGRPDLLHMTLLSVMGTPLYQDGNARIIVHTCAGRGLEIEEKTRIPKSYFRFRNLVEGVLSGEKKADLIRVSDVSLASLVREMKPDLVLGLSTLGKPQSLRQTAVEIGQRRSPVVLIGGFPKGHFSPSTLEVVEELVRIDGRSLEGHVVASRLVYEVEKALEDKR